MGLFDFAIIACFLLFTLVVGLRSARNVNNIKDYALGGRNFSTTAIASTIVATWISGSMFFIDLSNTYSDGLSYFIPSISMALQILFTAFFIVPRMGEFLGKISVAEAMGSLYGPKIRNITAVCGIAANIGGIAVQFKVFGTLFNYFLGIPNNYAIFIASAIVILYSSIGGIRAVTRTDIIQFITFTFVIPAIGVIIWNHFHSLGLSFEGALNNPIFDYKQVLSFSNPNLGDMIFLVIYFSIPAIDSMDFQRISIGKDIAQVRKAMLGASVIVALITIFVAWIPFLIFNINPNLENNNLLGYIIDNYAYTGFKGMIVVGIAAMAMSTADSRINSASVLFAHDLRRLLNIKANELVVSKFFALFLGCFSIYLALSKNDLLSIVRASASFYMPIVSVPFLMSIFGFRSSGLSVLIGMVGGFVTVLTWGYLDTGIDDDIVPGMVINLLLLMGSHYLLKQPGGWIGIKNKGYLYRAEVQKTANRRKITNYFKDFTILKFCLNNAPKDERMYSFFGVFCFISNICTIYLTHDYQTSLHSDFVLAIYQSMMVIAAFFLLYAMWSDRIRNRNLVSVIWNIALVHILVICSTFFVLLSDFGKLQLVIFTLNLMVLFTLTRWRISILMSVLGMFIGTQMYKICSGVNSINFSVNDDSYANLIYILIISATAVITFLKPKQEYVEATEAKVDHLSEENTILAHKNTTLVHKIDDYSDKLTLQEKEIARLGETAQRILNNVNHELRLPVGNVINFAEMLSEGLGKYSEEQLKELSDEVVQNTNRLSSMILNMLDLATLDVKKIELSKRTTNLSGLVEERAKHCFKLYKDNRRVKFKLDIEPEILVKVDPNYIRQTVDNLVINAINYSEKGTITVTLRKNQTQIIFTITDEGMGIPQNELLTIFEPFQQSSKTTSKAEGRGVGLALCKAAVEAHGGVISAESDGNGARFRFVLSIPQENPSAVKNIACQVS